MAQFPSTSSASDVWNMTDVYRAEAGGNWPSVVTVPGAPTIGTATGGNTQASVTFTAPASDGGSAITGYRVTSTPGSITATGASSPIVITGLSNGTAYTFTVAAQNSVGYGAESTASNSVTPVAAAPSTIDLLVVAGGGAAAERHGGGGGAGGYFNQTNFAVAAGTYNLTIGSGGSGSSSSGGNGNNSTFSTITAVGGGGGAISGSSNSGGSGAGAPGGGNAGSGTQPSQSGASGTYGFGNNGGGNQGDYGGGGGGAGAVGGTGNSGGNTTGAGGAGKQWSNGTFYGGGGAGAGRDTYNTGAGGTGGGGGGTRGTSGTANTGGGGAGGNDTGVNGGNGGSGVVILRYADTFTAAASTTGSPTITVSGGFRTYSWTGSGSITF